MSDYFKELVRNPKTGKLEEPEPPKRKAPSKKKEPTFDEKMLDTLTKVWDRLTEPTGIYSRDPVERKNAEMARDKYLQEHPTAAKIDAELKAKRLEAQAKYGKAK